MKHLVSVIWVVMVVLGAVVTGCEGARRYDSRLAAADSLMRVNPDSALAMVEAISRDSLPDEGDRAYRDLLLTQARYKAYVTATSDSDINRALAWFRAHPSDHEKLTRAYIYKGAVMDELGHPDSAMLYYKTAEATATPDDYFNLGYVNKRISTLYNDQLSQDTSAIISLKRAIYFFEIINDTNYLITCYGDMGGLCGINYPDTAEYYLTKAIELAMLKHSPLQYTYKSKLAGLYFYHNHDYSHAVALAMDVFRNGRELCNENQFYYYATWSYIRMGLLDSARFVLSSTPTPKDAVDSMNRYQTDAEMAKAKKDLITFGANMAKSKDSQIKVLTNRNDDMLKVAESEFRRIQVERHDTQTKQHNHNLATALTLSIIIILSLILLVHYLKWAIRRKEEERKGIERQLTTQIGELQERLTNGSVSELVACRFEALNELFDSIKFRAKEKNSGRIRSVIPLSSVITGLSKTYSIMKVQLTEKFWDKMKQSVDGEYNGIISYVEQEYPNLTEKEIELFCLQCANISPQIIKLCMNYTNVNSVFNRRNIIIKEKMGLNMTMDEFIEKYMKNEL